MCSISFKRVPFEVKTEQTLTGHARSEVHKIPQVRSYATVNLREGHEGTVTVGRKGKYRKLVPIASGRDQAGIAIVRIQSKSLNLLCHNSPLRRYLTTLSFHLIKTYCSMSMGNYVTYL